MSPSQRIYPRNQVSGIFTEQTRLLQTESAWVGAKIANHIIEKIPRLAKHRCRLYTGEGRSGSSAGNSNHRWYIYIYVYTCLLLFRSRTAALTEEGIFSSWRKRWNIQTSANWLSPLQSTNATEYSSCSKSSPGWPAHLLTGSGLHPVTFQINICCGKLAFKNIEELIVLTTNQIALYAHRTIVCVLL